MKMVLTEYMLAELLRKYDETDVRTDYSGRGMYGRTCVGYEGDEPFTFAFDLARLLCGTSEEGEDAEAYADALREVMSDLSSPARDSMGLGTIYYWTNLTMEDGE